MQGMGGQSSVQFDLVAGYEVLDCTEAEGWAFLQIDQKGLRKHPNTRIELVKGDLPTFQAICARAANASIENSLIQLRQQEGVAKALGLNVLKPGYALQAPMQSRKFWLDAFAFTVQFGGQPVSLESLMSQAASNPAARKRLNQMGMTCCALTGDYVGFQIDWSRTTALLKHQCMTGHESPEEYQAMVKFKLTKTAQSANRSKTRH